MSTDGNAMPAAAAATHDLYAAVCHCGAPMRLRQTTKFKYGNGEPRKFWGCSRWPDCDGIIGAHPSGEPVGIPGDEETKRARQAAHAAFDPLWYDAPKFYEIAEEKNPGRGRAINRIKRRARTRAYAWLGKVLGLTEDECHIGMFDKEMCAKVVLVVRGMDGAAVRGWAKARGL